MTNSIFVPLVGAHYRPPAKQVLAVLPAGASLSLVPDPENPYDSKAIKVFVSGSEVPDSQLDALASSLDGTGHSLEDLVGTPGERGQDQDGPDYESDGVPDPIWLGFVGDSEGKVCRERAMPGNGHVAALAAEASCQISDLSARLGFDAEGRPGVTVAAPAASEDPD